MLLLCFLQAYASRAVTMVIMKSKKKLIVLLIFLLTSVRCLAAESKPIVILTTFSEHTISQIVDKYHEFYPGADIRIIFRRTRSMLRLLEKDDYQNIDIVISSSPVLFHHLANNKKLHTFSPPYSVPSWLAPHILDISGKVTAFGYSGFGLISNEQYLTSHGLPIPETWEDLTNAQFFQHITMSTPSRSGTTNLMVENILQHYGWEEGWRLLMKIGGNIAFISSRSFGVSEAVSRGLIGAGPVIDSYAINSIKVFDYVGFKYLTSSILMPTYIGIAKNSQHINDAIKFVDFLRSKSGQQLLEKTSIAKFSLSQPKLAETTSFILNKQLVHSRDKLISFLFDQAITEQLHQLNTTWESIHQLESQVNLSSEALKKLVRAKQYASQVPVTAEQSISEEYLVLFNNDNAKRGRDPIMAKEIQQWKETLRNNLQQANLLTSQIHQEQE
ncbi:ABC transporter substrate-binding protein [Photobacterium chitinilyticum]|uniref:ABC transporter substrate-binding protein n=2 Tax=Photobacterium chitinilyticum TaxID=2485123 RepID=A0A3S3QTJ2_9GAMM|nr:ABC transporter substrate-binding protein [Photobacterium chitinilyticum]